MLSPTQALAEELGVPLTDAELILNGQIEFGLDKLLKPGRKVNCITDSEGRQVSVGSEWIYWNQETRESRHYKVSELRDLGGSGFRLFYVDRDGNESIGMDLKAVPTVPDWAR